MLERLEFLTCRPDLVQNMRFMGMKASDQEFDEVKKQLGELIEIVNGFKSEAVQLRIVESLLAGMGGRVSRDTSEGTDQDDDDESSKPRKSKRRKAKGSGNGEASASTRSASKKGPKAGVMALIESGFLSHKRTAPDVQVELKDKKAMNFSVSTVQTTLNRLLEDDAIKRERDEETKQFRYWK